MNRYASTVARYAKKSGPLRKRYRVYTPALKQLGSDVLYLKSIINSELKIHTVQASNNFSYNGIVQSLCDVPVGDLENTRDGNSILPRYLSIHGHYGCGTLLTSGNGITVRCIVFKSYIESTSSAGVSIVVDPDEVLSDVGTQYSVLSHLNSDNTAPKGDRARRIEILKNELIHCVPASSSARSAFQFNFELNGPKVSRKEHIVYTNASTLQPISGGLYIMFISSSATGTDAEFTIESKMSFYDN